MVIVIVMKGKGSGSADYVGYQEFNDDSSAEKYISEVNDTKSKYWTYAQIMHAGDMVETYCENDE
ncbi:hypothetical protein D3C85_384940 [compost metagenome]